MKRRTFLHQSSLAGTGICLAPSILSSKSAPIQKVGMIGLDTSHAPAFTKIINAKDDNGGTTGFKITHAYPHGSRDIESSVSRIPKYTKEMESLGVEIVSSISDLLKEVDVVLLETNDGRLHLEQAKEVIAANKPMFIDKPMAASLKDVVAIFSLAKKNKVPIFSSSSLRFSPSMYAIKNGEIGKVLGADTYCSAKIEKTHPDLFWYGIHGIESLYALLGTGCKTVRRVHNKGTDLVTGEWNDGRIGTFRGLRTGKTNYGGTAYGTEGIVPAGIYEGYQHLVKEIIQFFNTKTPPVSAEETIEIFAFMEAADLSKKKKGKPISIEKILKKAH